MVTFTRVQHNNMATTTVTAASLAATLGSGVTSGNLLVATIAVGTNVGTITPPAGWAQAGPTETVTSSLQTQIFYLVVGTGGATSFTFSWSGSHSFGWTIDEWNSSIGWQASPVDSSAGAVHSTASTAVNCGSPGATTQASELWYGVLSWADSGETLSGVTAGWTTGDTAVFTSNNTNTSFYQTVSATGTPSLAATISASVINAGVVATFATSSSVIATPGRAAATGTGQPPTAQVTAAAGLAAGTGAAQLPGNGRVPAVAAATGTAYQPSVSTTGNQTVFPGCAAGTGTAYQPAITASASVAAVPAAGTGTAYQPAVTGSANVSAGLAAATGTAYQPSVSASGNQTVFPGAAVGAGTAYQPTAAIGFTLGNGLAAATGTALPVIFYSTSPGLVASGFGPFPQVPVNSAVLAVIANITQHGSDAAVAAPSYELWDGTTARIGIPQPGTASTSVSNMDIVVFTGASYFQLATLQLRIYARSAEPGNSGATTSVDAVSLSVEWAPATSVFITPSAQKSVTKFPAQVVTVGRTVLPDVLVAASALPAVTTGTLLPGIITPIVLAVARAIPEPTIGAGITAFPGVLARVPGLPPVTDVTAPNYATAESLLTDGSGSWASAVNVTGAPDGNDAIWTVP